MVVIVHSNATENQTKPKQQNKNIKKKHKQTSKSTKTRLEVNSWLAPSHISPLGSLMSRF